MSLAVQVSRGRPQSRLYQIAHRIASRLEPRAAQAFLRSIERLQGRIDEALLRSALASKSTAQVQAAVRAEELALILENSGLTNVLETTATATGQAGADVLTDVLGVEVRFNSLDPNAVLYARTQAAQLIVAVTDDVKEAVRIIIAASQTYGLTIDQQAVAIRELVGLPPNWVNAPLNLAQEIRDGTVNYDRRLSAIDKAKIRSRIQRGTVTEQFVEEMQATYAKRLIQRRALNIARTETMRAANFGQRENWRQARRNNLLPQTARRVWIVTPDDRLRETHAAVPGMNPDGVPIDGGVYQTPLGPSDGPPLEVNCRCSEGLDFPGLPGVL